MRTLLLCLLALPWAAMAHQDPLLDSVEIVTGGAAKDARLPLLIAVHGLGDRPEAFVRLFEDLPLQVRVVAPRGKRPYGRGHTWFALAQDEGQDRIADMRDSARRLAHLAETLRQSRPTVGKPVITGFSQGGMLSFLACAEHPERFAACVPIAGLLPRELYPKAAHAGAPPVIALHGDADDRLPVAGARATVEAFRAVKRPADLTEFPKVRHRIPGPVRSALFDALARALPTP
ncbi:MAG: dienelactone hydrolase family protein [Myxococcales bacterium]|nr:dienelactone hydrolase family protein [Myxococcales bacterium]